jgi:hypothetical protein
VSRVPLSDNETRVIFAGECESNLAALEGREQQAVLNRLLSIVENPSNPRAFVHERIQNLDIITAGDQIRLYSRVVEDIPQGDSVFHVIYIFYIDDDHDYQNHELSTYSVEAQNLVEIVTALELVSDVEEYFEEMNALDADDLRDLLDR